MAAADVKSRPNYLQQLGERALNDKERIAVTEIMIRHGLSADDPILAIFSEMVSFRADTLKILGATRSSVKLILISADAVTKAESRVSQSVRDLEDLWRDIKTNNVAQADNVEQSSFWEQWLLGYLSLMFVVSALALVCGIVIGAQITPISIGPIRLGRESCVFQPKVRTNTGEVLGSCESGLTRP